MSTICPFCGAELSDDAKFCTSCGNSISKVTEETKTDEYTQETVVDEKPVYSEPSYSESMTYGYAGNDSNVSKPGKGFAIASLVLGIFSVLCCFLYFASWLPAILAIIFGIVALAKKQSKGMAIAGIICGVIGLLLVVFIIVSALSLLSSPEGKEMINQILSEAGLSEYYNF